MTERDFSPQDRLDAPGGELDVLNAVFGASPYDDLRKRSIEAEVRGTLVRIASLDDMIAMKWASGRPQDLRDIADLTGLEESGE